MNMPAEWGKDEQEQGQIIAAFILNVEEVQQMVSWMTARLIRKKVLSKWRLFDYYYLAAIDGTGVLSFSERHCPYCLTQKLTNGSTRLSPSIGGKTDHSERLCILIDDRVH